MGKIVIFFKRKPGIPGIRRYVQNAMLASGYRKGEPAFDAVAESWFDDTQAMEALARTPEYAKVLADEPNFIDAASMGSIVTDEHVIKEGPAPRDAVKSIDVESQFANGVPALSNIDLQLFVLCRVSHQGRRQAIVQAAEDIAPSLLTNDERIARLVASSRSYEVDIREKL